MIKCGHCKGVHENVNRVYVCSIQEQEMIAQAKIEAEIEEFERYCETELCSHGLSLWLCADPINHYPADNMMDCW